MNTRRSFLFILVALSGFLPQHLAHASCNQIPSADALQLNTLTDSDTNPSAVPDSFLKDLEELTWNGQLPFKGALGRASRSLIVPTPNTGITVAPDFTCVGGDLDLEPRNSVTRDELVSAIFYYHKSEDGSVSHVFARMFADNDDYCERIDKGLPVSSKAKRAFEFSVIEGCTRKGWELTGERQRYDKTEYTLALPLLDGDIDSTRGVSPDVRVVVMRSPNADALAEMTRKLAGGRTCKAKCTEPGATKNVDVCIDQLYQTDKIEDGYATKFSLDIMGCNIAIPQSGIQCEQNDYQELCTGLDVPGFAECKGASSGKNDMVFWRSRCGGIHFPFSWAKIREDPSDITKRKDRVLAGLSPASRKKKTAGDGNRIYMPGREFVGSTGCVAHCDDPPCTNAGDWRIPEVDLWTTASAFTSFGLTGVVDKDDSVLHVFPRAKAAIQCSDPNDPTIRHGCMKIDQYQGHRQALCACSDREPIGCNCPEPVTPRFFECEAPPNSTAPYDYTGLPCTRHDHCPYGGYCSADPTCVAEDAAVWEKGAAIGTIACQDDNPCPTAHVCGFRLFDFSQRVNADHVGKFRRKVKGQGNTKDTRGFCSNEPDKKCNKDQKCQSLPSCVSACECTGFLAQAEGNP